VRLSVLARILLILSALTTSAARLHAHAVDSVYATQELNHCLRVVAASRKQTSKSSPCRDHLPAPARAGEIERR
jgi:hypothetical protein